MIKIAVCDDEKIYSDRICSCICREMEKQNVVDYKITVYNSGTEFVSDGEKIYEYDVIFLDINMPDVNGFELASKIKDNNNTTYIVFVTSFLNYAIQGYRFDALRFILKSEIDNLMPECIETIVRLMMIDFFKIEYDFVEGKQEVIVSKLSYIESKKHKLIYNFYNDDKKLKIYKKLDDAEKDLDGCGFLRIHKSYLVNVKYIKKLINYAVILQNGTELPVPKNNIKLVKKKYYEMRGDRL